MSLVQCPDCGMHTESDTGCSHRGCRYRPAPSVPPTATAPATARPHLRTIAGAPKDGSEVIVCVCIATVWLMRNAHWDDGSLWEMQGYANQEEARGWWAYENSVSQTKLEGIYEPTHYFDVPEMPR